MKDKLLKNTKLPGLAVVIFAVLLSFWAVRPLLPSGFFPIHDQTQIVRVQQMAVALKAGQLPVRWVPDLGYGYGYPIFNFYAPLAYYFGGMLVLAGLPVMAATKLMFGLPLVLAGLSMYHLAKFFWGRRGGLLATALYVYAPYHAVQAFVRGAVGELWAYAFLPWVFLAIFRVANFRGRTHQPPPGCADALPGGERLDLANQPQGMAFANPWGWTIFGALALAAVILSHNLTALMLAPFLGLVIVVGLFLAKSKRRFILNSLFIILLAIGIASFYWLPALAEMKFTKVFGQLGGGADWRDHFVYLDQLWASPWGWGGSAPGRLDGLSFMIGKLHLLLAGLGIAGGFYFWRQKRWGLLQKASLLGGGLMVLLAVFFTNRFSWPAWEVISPLGFIQYPWRFLGLAALGASFLAGSLGFWLKNKGWAGWLMLAVLLAGAISFNQKYFRTQYVLDRPETEWLSEENIKWTTSRISDEYLPRDFSVPESEGEVAWQPVTLSGEGEWRFYEQKTPTRWPVEVTASEPVQVQLNLADFPGWEVVFENFLPERVSADRGIGFLLPAGTSRLEAEFTDTPVRTLANILTAVFLLGLTAGMAVRFKVRRRRDRI